MRWYALASLAVDSRIKYLIIFIFVAIVVAGVLSYFEHKLRKKTIAKKEKSAEESLIDYLGRCSLSDKNPTEKLALLDRSIKGYFRDSFGFNLNSSYSQLANEFEKKGKVDLAKFCKEIFSVYYSSEEISSSKVKGLFTSFEGIVRSRKGKVLNVRGKTKDKFAGLLDNLFRKWKLVKSKLISRKMEFKVHKDAKVQAKISSMNDQVRTRVLKAKAKANMKKKKSELKRKHKKVREIHSKNTKIRRRRVLNHLKKGATLSFFNMIGYLKKKKINLKNRIIRSKENKKKALDKKKIYIENKKVLQTKAKKIEELERAHLKYGILIKRVAQKKGKEQKKKLKKEQKELLRREKKAIRIKKLVQRNALRKLAMFRRKEARRLVNLDLERRILLKDIGKKKRKLAKEKSSRIAKVRRKILKDELRYRNEQIRKEKTFVKEQKKKEREARWKMNLLLKKQKNARFMNLKKERQKTKLRKNVLDQKLANDLKSEKKLVSKSKEKVSKIKKISRDSSETSFFKKRVSKESSGNGVYSEAQKRKDIRKKIRFAGLLKKKKLREDRKFARNEEKMIRKEKKKKDKFERLERKRKVNEKKTELFEVRRVALEKKKHDELVQKKVQLETEAEGKLEIKRIEGLMKDKGNKILKVENKRKKIIGSYPIGSHEWMKELEKNSRK